MDENMGNDTLNLPQEEYEPVVSQPVNMSMLEAEITICAFDIGEDHVFKTCYGDICKTVNALRDYSRILEMSCETWDLQGYHKTLYELHAQMNSMHKSCGKLRASSRLGLGMTTMPLWGNAKNGLRRKTAMMTRAVRPWLCPISRASGWRQKRKRPPRKKQRPVCPWQLILTRMTLGARIYST